MSLPGVRFCLILLCVLPYTFYCEVIISHLTSSFISCLFYIKYFSLPWTVAVGSRDFFCRSMEAYNVELPKGTRSQGLNLNMYTLSTPTKTTAKALTSPVRLPQFLTTAPPSSSGGAVIYDHKTMNRILQEAQLEAPVSSGSPLGDKDRLSTKILVVIDKACLWHLLPASELVTQKLSDVIHCRHLLSTIVYGLEGCGLISSQDRYDTVGGPVIPPARDATKIAAAVTKATGFPSLLLITGNKEMKYLPTRENFEKFLSSLIPYTATFDPALAGLIREVANTHAPDLTVIQRWENALGFAGMSLFIHYSGLQVQHEFRPS